MLRVLLLRTLLCFLLAAPGLWRNRIPLARKESSLRSIFPLLRDVMCVVCENHLFLAAWWWFLRGSPVPGGASNNVKVAKPTKHGTLLKQSSNGRSSSHKKSTRKRRVLCHCILLFKTILLLVLTGTWILASWGDYVFQQQSMGMIPHVEYIASGLADPSIHLQVQLDPAHRRVFWTGLFEILACLGLVAFLIIVLRVFVGYHQYKQRQKWKLPLPSAVSSQEKERSAVSQGYFCCLEDRICLEFLMTSRLSLGLHAWGWIFLYTSYNAWAPLLNLTTAWMLSCAWVLQAGATATTTALPKGDTSILAQIDMEPTTIPNNGTQKNTTTNAKNNRNKKKNQNKRPPSQKKIPPVNVIIVVHESLAASAMESTRGQRAAPWFTSNIMNQEVKTENRTYAAQNNPNFYYFSSATSPAGGTPTATPAILTGLLTYNTKGMNVMRQSGLATDFQTLGYETASFVSYGATWKHTTWRVLTDLFTMPEEDPREMELVLDPATTGEPRVNEYGMDDRRMVQYIDTWLQLRQKSPEYLQENTMSRNGRDKNKQHNKKRNKKQPRTNVTVTSTRAEQVIRGTKYGLNHTTASDGKNGTQPKRTLGPPPFFAQVIFNNQHFPHLMHEHYTGLEAMDCEYEYSDDYFGMSGHNYEGQIDMDHDYGNGSITADGVLGTDNSTDDDDFEAQHRQHRAMHPSSGDGSSEHPYREPCWEDTQNEPISRYFSSLRTMDESLQALFDALNRTGELDNTIVMGAGDHGETPGLTKRLEDTDATIMRVPLWMHIPERLLANRYAASTEQTPKGKATNKKNSRAKKAPTKVHTTKTSSPYDLNISQTSLLVSDVLRSNAHQSVSTLDIVPTLRDVLNFPRVFTKQQEATCITGRSLAKERLPDERLAVGWGGSPLAGVFIASFATKTQALLVCPKEMEKSRVVKLHEVTDGDDPFYRLFERKWDNLEEGERKQWKRALQDQGWLSSAFTKTHLPEILRSDGRSKFWGDVLEEAANFSEAMGRPLR